jgi:ADP-heptose:LPS heptosyltransferase
MPRQIILDKGQSPGDIVVFTGALRDLKIEYPEWSIDVRSCCMDVFANNPHITKVQESHPATEYYDVGYSDIHTDRVNYIHFSSAYHNELTRLLKLDKQLPQTSIYPDLHLTNYESKTNMVDNCFGYSGPFWLINCGHKNDFVLKQWGEKRWQKVVDLLKEDVQFVQVGEVAIGHYHPELKNVIDLRGKTNLRDLIVLSSVAKGAVSHVSLLMHLVAAWHKPCVTVAGGREPWRWEAYPNHQFLHTVGKLDCCRMGGCWLSGYIETNDDGSRINKKCKNMVGCECKCMAMIDPELVAAHVKEYVINQ